MSSKHIPLNRTYPVDCLIPAAGLSSRMGRWKMMLPLGSSQHTLLDYSIQNALTFCQRVILVTGYRGDELYVRYHDRPEVKLVFNADYKKGLFSSLQRGIQEAETDYLFIAHGDMPSLSNIIFLKLWQVRNRDHVTFPSFQGQTGHPVLLPREAYLKALNSPASSQMKSLLKALPHDLVEMDSPHILLDLDTPEAYSRFLEKHHNNRA